MHIFPPSFVDLWSMRIQYYEYVYLVYLRDIYEYLQFCIAYLAFLRLSQKQLPESEFAKIQVDKYAARRK